MIAARQVLSTFDIKPSAATAPADSELDELMIDWRALPARTAASIYLPAVSADAIITAAGAMYGSQPFTRIDGNTIGCEAKGVVFMPIPRGSGNFAGLLRVLLPNTFHKAGKFTVTVSQLTNAEALRRRPESIRRWRKVLGTFQLALAISGKTESLTVIEQNLALLRWISGAIPPANRWHPIFLRYIAALGEQIAGLGGDPAAIPPSATGTWPGAGKRKGGREGWPGTLDHPVGRIAGLVYDDLGEFEGFVLETEDGHSFTFYSRETHVAVVVDQACREGLRVTVILDHLDRDRPRRVILEPASPPV